MVDISPRGLAILLRAPRPEVQPGVELPPLRLLTNRTNLTLSPRMALAVNMQYNSTSNSIVSSIRYRWEYQGDAPVDEAVLRQLRADREAAFARLGAILAA